MIQLSYENVTAYIRIASYWLCGMLVTRGVINGTNLEFYAGAGVTFVTFLWTLWGQRVVAKINEIAKMDFIKVVQVAPTTEGKAVAASVQQASPEAKETVVVAPK